MDQISPAPPTSERQAFDVPLDGGATAHVRVFGRGPRVVCSHGNGLAIDAFRAFWQVLATDFEVVAVDLRHHGRSSPYTAAYPIGPDSVWPQMIRDFDVILTGIGSELGAAPSLGAFHSMSALTALLHATSHATPWIGIVGFEPPVTPPLGHPDHAPFSSLNGKLAERAAQRRTTFGAVSELADSFRRSPAFAGVDDVSLLALAQATLRWDGDRNLYELACAREVEAAIFAMRQLDGAWDAISGLTLPVQLVAGLPPGGAPSGFVDVERALAAQGGFAFTTVPDATHFMQLEKPAACAALVAAFHALLTR